MCVTAPLRCGSPPHVCLLEFVLGLSSWPISRAALPYLGWPFPRPPPIVFVRALTPVCARAYPRVCTRTPLLPGCVKTFTAFRSDIFQEPK
ncbi:hypothetical protein BGX38DRAFT_1247440 [Terfezia claveryi]|nr:hypothetical protein BGX38DRAFT_1247440 [Terfezia claveryi]